jgi:hypothetical protein
MVAFPCTPMGYASQNPGTRPPQMPDRLQVLIRHQGVSYTVCHCGSPEPQSKSIEYWWQRAPMNQLGGSGHRANTL